MYAFVLDDYRLLDGGKRKVVSTMSMTHHALPSEEHPGALHASTVPMALLEILFDRMPMGIAIFDQDMRLRRCNPTWAEFIDRYTPSTASQVVPGVYFFDLAPGTEGEMLPIFERVLAGEKIHLETLRLESGGLVSYWNVVFAPLIEDSEVVGFVDVTTDVTERQRMVEMLGESEAKFRLLFQKSPDAMLLLDGDVFIDCNQAAVEMMGCASKKQLLALHPYDISPERQPDGRLSVEKARELIDRAYQEGCLRFEWVHRRTDGRDLPVEVLLTAIPLPGKQILHVSLRDITERKQAEEALQSAYQTLEQRVEERTRELSILLEVSHNVASTLELEPLLGLILDQLKVVVDYSGASILILEGKDLVILAHRGPIPQEEALQLRFSLKDAEVNREVIRRREPVIIPDVRGDTLLARAFRETAGGRLETTFGYVRSWMGVPLMIKDQVVGMLTLDHDKPDYYSPRQAELALAFANQAAMAIENARLYQAEQERVEETERRRRVAEGLRDVLRVINSNRPPEEILDYIISQAIRLLDTDAGAIYRLRRESGLLDIQAHRGLEADYAKGMTIPLGKGTTGRAVQERRPVAIPDTSVYLADLKEIHQAALEPEQRALLAQAAQRFGAMLAVPLTVKDQVYGAISLYYRKPRQFSEEEMELAVTFADQAALAIENARLHQAEQARQRELQTLLDVAAAASSSLNLDEMLMQTLDRLVALVGASRAGVMLLDVDSGELEPRMLRPERPIAPDDLAELTRACREVIASGEPLYVPPDEERGFIEPGALLPLRVRGQVLGVLVIVGPEGRRFSRGQLALFESIADQVGVAVENARLYEQAEQAAAAAERSRLARDLHDAVTQTLFSASLIAEVLPRLWERDPEEGRRRLEELRQLTRGALAEMRTLLLELRPSALIDAELGDLLRQLAESITGRARLPVAVEVEGQCALPPAVKVALYRIAQEALNNVTKHARASRVSVRLHCAPPLSPPQAGGMKGGEVELCISDDGRGFDPEDVPPKSLGLGIMRERAEAVGAALTVNSEIGRGTEVVVEWMMDGG